MWVHIHPNSGDTMPISQYTGQREQVPRVGVARTRCLSTPFPTFPH